MRHFAKPLLLPLALLLCAPAAWADDPVPPPAPAPVPAPLTPAPAPTPPTAVDPAWSGPPPAPELEPVPAPDPVPAPEAAPTAPSTRVDTSNLPPPVIRRAGQPRPAAPAATGTAPYVPPYVPPYVAPYAPQPPLTYTYPLGAPPPTPDSVALPPPAAPLAPLAAASILDVAKNHNMPLSDGSLALRLDTRFRVDDPVSRAYRVWITFFDRSSGAAIQSTKPTFADSQGALYVLTKPVTSTVGGQEFVAPLTVPYLVFPDPGAGNSTEIEARVELTRVEAGSQETPVATSSTTFRVHGAPLEQVAAPGTESSPPGVEFRAPGAEFPAPRPEFPAPR